LETALQTRTKILIVIGTLDSGGCERHLLSILPHLEMSVFEVRVFTLLRRGVLADEMERRGIKVKSPSRKFSPKGYSFFARFYRLVNTAFSLRYELRAFQPDIVHFFLPGSYLIGAPIARLCGFKRMIMSRRSLANYQAKHRWAAFFERLLHPRMSLLLGNSRAVMTELQQECPGCHNLELLYNGIEVFELPSTNERKAIRSELGLDDNTVAIGILANLIPYKGHADLIQACAKINKQINRWKLFIIGRDDGIGPDLKTLSSSLGIAGKVVFLGERSDARSLLGAMDIGVSASHEEGFSNAILEFMAAGVTVVATNAGGNAEAVADGLTGSVVPIGDHKRMAEAIDSLLADNGLRQRMGKTARTTVCEKFSIEACVAGYESVYRRVMERAQVK
jgi:glycosyltransferase involved in cell wall biosynthesis